MSSDSETFLNNYLRAPVVCQSSFHLWSFGQHTVMTLRTASGMCQQRCAQRGPACACSPLFHPRAEQCSAVTKLCVSPPSSPSSSSTSLFVFALCFTFFSTIYFIYTFVWYVHRTTYGSPDL